MNIRYAYKLVNLLPVAIVMALLAGCSSTDVAEPEPVESAPVEASPPPAPPGPSAAELAEQRKREQMLATRLFYFDFDKSDLKPEALEPLRYHAQQLKDNPSMRVRLEGHADERGTSEYNLALGERRAQSVQRYLQAQGVSARQMEVISYGEERPAVNASNEQAWARNRRTELVY